MPPPPTGLWAPGSKVPTMSSSPGGSVVEVVVGPGRVVVVGGRVDVVVGGRVVVVVTRQGAMQRGSSFGGSLQQPLFGVSQK